MKGKRKTKPHWPSYARLLKRDAGKIVERGGGNFEPLIKKALEIEDAYYRSQALAWIARRMVAAGVNGDTIFSRAAKEAKTVEPDWRRNEIIVHVGSEMSRAKAGQLETLFEAISTISDPGHKQETLKVLRRRMKRAGMEFPGSFVKGNSREKTKHLPEIRSVKKNKKLVTLGIFNTYAGKDLQDPHIRAIARAAPLCYAFGLNLCLFAFPVKDALEALSRVEQETRVGKSGNYLMRLFEEDRFFVLGVPKDPVLSSVGELVATTSKPDPKKRADIEKIAEKESPFCTLVGLGSRGLPKHVLNMCNHHLELTGNNVSLETCTAMGVLAAKISACTKTL